MEDRIGDKREDFLPNLTARQGTAPDIRIGPIGAPKRLPVEATRAQVSYIIDAERNEVTSSQLAVEGEIEQSQIPNSVRYLELDPNGPGLFRLEGRLGSYQLAAVPRCIGLVGVVGSPVLHCSAPETKPQQ